MLADKCVLEQEPREPGAEQAEADLASSAELNICRESSCCLLCVYFSHWVLFFSRKRTDSFGTAAEELPRTFWELREMPLDYLGLGWRQGGYSVLISRMKGGFIFIAENLKIPNRYKDISHL